MQRRRFNAILGNLGLTSALASGGGGPEVLRLSPNGWMPNNQQLPVLLYRSAITPDSSDPAAAFERAFTQNGWPPQWRDGVYEFHHYHSTAHEVLGFASGRARIVLGGEGGHALQVQTGDVAVLPVGTGHCKIEASGDFLVVGAYPPDQHWDICRTAPSPEALRRMESLPFPKSDPVSGPSGPLVQLWRHA